LVQIDEAAVLHCLVKHHGLKAVFAEGLTQEGLPAYEKNIEAIRPLFNQLDELRGKLRDVRELVNDSVGERRERAQAVEAEIGQMIQDRTRALIAFGATARLQVAGSLKVMPLD